MTPTKDPARTVKNKVPLSPAELLGRQEARGKSLSLILSLLMVVEGIALLGGVGMWVILGQAHTQTTASAEVVAAAQSMLPYARLMTFYTALALLVTFMSQRAVHERAASAWKWMVGTLIVYALAIPLGTLTALVLLFFMPPKRWLDARPKVAPAAAS